MVKNKWILEKLPNQDVVDKLAAEININTTLATILVQRGIDSYQKAKDFFVPNLEQLHDPFLMKDMDVAVKRVLEAFEKKEKILVYGDYDVDGTTAVAVMYSFLSEFHEFIDYYIPDRYSEGYGISSQGVQFAADNGFKLIIALDCGIKAVDKVDEANRLGVDFIICDHHLPGAKIPAAIAVLDPKRDDCEYPYKELCGCGVGFKLIQAICLDQGWPMSKAYEYLDLVAISIAADIVPVVGENRILSYYGIKQINEQPKRIGLKALLEKANLKRDVTVTDLVFIIAPRINAAGRITTGKNAVKLLVEKETGLAREIGNLIDQNNLDRKDLDKSITAEALDMINESDFLRNSKSTVVYNENWHKGVVGIVASRLTESFYRPTIVLTKSGEKVAGSARSVIGYDVYNAINSCSHFLEQFGGHKYAAGLTMLPENIDKFRLAFEEIVSSTITPEQLQPVLKIDARMNFSLINDKFNGVLKRLAPFGPENLEPVFYSENIVDAGYARIVGDNHLKCLLYQTDNPKIRFDAIGFKLGEHLTKLKQGVPFKIAYTIEENVWNNQIALQLKLKDLQPME